MKYVNIFSVTSKSAMTPSFIGLIATMLPGVRPSMSLASLPTASTRPLTLLIATIDGSLTTMPFPRAYTQVLAVPRSIARSLEKSENNERRLILPKTFQSELKTQNSKLRTQGLLLGDLDAVLASLFHPIHRLIGGTNQPLHRARHVRERRDADRCGQVNRQPFALQEAVRRDPLAHALANHHCAIGARIGQDDGELVAAEARHHVGLARARADDHRRL